MDSGQNLARSLNNIHSLWCNIASRNQLATEEYKDKRQPYFSKSEGGNLKYLETETKVSAISTGNYTGKV